MSEKIIGIDLGTATTEAAHISKFILPFSIPFLFRFFSTPYPITHFHTIIHSTSQFTAKKNKCFEPHLQGV